MPPIRSTISKRRTTLTISISLDGEIISSYSRYTKKGLVYITLPAPSGRKPSSYSEYTKSNTYSLYNVRSVSLNKYVRLIRL